MNYQCPDCGGPLVYDPEKDAMVCTQCGDHLDSSGLSERTQYMEMNVYRCTSCGAQLMVNGNESATFCSYCGHPTVVFDRVSKEQQPDYILPFKITETQALDLIKKWFKKGKYIPDDVKNPKIDKLRGIYIPFWLYTSYIRMQANISTETGSSKNKHIVCSFRDAECTYEKVTMDASKKLNDVLSQRLEPYDMSALQPFQAEYLSGFYADKYDVTAKELAGLARSRCEDFMAQTLKTSCPGGNKANAEIHEKRVKFDILSVDYALLPAWFLTFWYENELYTILVNGQTGKVIGNVPIDKKKCYARFAITAVITCILTTMIMLMLVAAGNSISDKISNWNIVIIFVSAFIYFIGSASWKHFNEDRARFKSNNTIQYVKGRQDKTWVR